MKKTKAHVAARKSAAGTAGFAMESLESRRMLSAAVTPTHLHASMIGAELAKRFDPANGYLPAAEGTLPDAVELKFHIAPGDDYWIYYTTHFGAPYKYFYKGAAASGNIKVDIPVSSLQGKAMTTTSAYWNYTGDGDNEGIVYFTIVATHSRRPVKPTTNAAGTQITSSGAAPSRRFCTPQMFFVDGDGQGPTSGNNDGQAYASLLDYYTLQYGGYGAQTHLFCWDDSQIAQQIISELPRASRRFTFPLALMGNSFGGTTAITTAWQLAADNVPISYLGLADVVPPSLRYPPAHITVLPQTGASGISPDCPYIHIQLPSSGPEANMVADNWFAYDELFKLPQENLYEACGPIATADPHFENIQAPLNTIHGHIFPRQTHLTWTPTIPASQIISGYLEGYKWVF